MRIMVTGVNGFVGKHLVNYLQTKKDIDVVAVTRQDFATDFERVSNIDAIINLASASSVEQSVKSPRDFIAGNMGSTLQVLEFARKKKVKLVVHMSTVEVSEITNPYGASKAAQENIIEAYSKTYDLPAVIVRSTNIVGSGQSREKFVPKIVEQIKNREVVMLYKSHGKIGSRAYVPVQNVVDALWWVTVKFTDTDIWRDFRCLEIDASDELTNYEMAKWVAQILKRKLHYEYVEPKARPVYARTLPSEATKLSEIGWKRPYVLGKGLAWIK